MSTNVSRQRPEKAFFDRLAAVESQVQQMRTLQPQGADAVNMQTQDYPEYSFTVAANATSWLQLRFTNSEGKPVFGVIEYTFYQGSKAIGNEVDASSGTLYWSNWDITMTPALYDTVDYGGESCLSYHFQITNKTAGDLTLVFTGRMRIIVSGGAAA